MKYVCPICKETYECELDWLPMFAPCLPCLAIRNAIDKSSERHPDLGEQAIQHRLFIYRQGSTLKDAPALMPF